MSKVQIMVQRQLQALLSLELLTEQPRCSKQTKCLRGERAVEAIIGRKFLTRPERNN